MLNKLSSSQKKRNGPGKLTYHLYYTRFPEIYSKHCYSNLGIFPRNLNSQILNRFRNKTTTKLFQNDYIQKDYFMKNDFLNRQQISSNDYLNSPSLIGSHQFYSSTSQKNNIYLCLPFDKGRSSTNILRMSNQNQNEHNHVDVNASTVCIHSENFLNINDKTSHVPDQSSKCDVTRRNAQRILHKNDMEYKNYSITRIDIEKWTFEIIQKYDPVNAAYLISSQIVNRIKNSLEKIYINERAYIHNILVQKDFQLIQLRNQNAVLLANLSENESSKNIQNSEVTSLSLNLATSPHHYKNNFLTGNLEKAKTIIVSQKSNSNFDLHINDETNTENFAPNYFKCRTKEFKIPEPPPNLPEFTDICIPDPPPDMPIEKQKNDVLSINMTKGNYYQLKVLKNPNNMKPLHWKKLIFPNHKIKHQVIWKKLPKIKPKSFELLQFEDYFSHNTMIKKRRMVANSFSYSTRVKECLPTELAKQLGIIFRRMESLHIDIEDLETMLISGDYKYTNINASLIENLSRLVTNDSINMVKDYAEKYPKVVLTLEENNLLKLGRLSHVVLRIKHVMFILNFDDEIKSIERNLKVIRNCCRYFMESSDIRSLLAIILYFGNYMNTRYDSFRDAVGFCIELLPRLKETKTRDKSSSFLEFVARYYLLSVREGSNASLLPFPDSGDLSIASNVRLEDLEMSVSNLRNQLIEIHESTKLSVGKDYVDKESEQHLYRVQTFFQIAEERLEEVNQLRLLCENIYCQVLIYFYGEVGEGKDKIDSIRFFSIWSEFSLIFKEALLKEHSKIVIHKKIPFYTSEAYIEPTSLNGLKLKVKSWKSRKNKYSSIPKVKS